MQEEGPGFPAARGRDLWELAPLCPGEVRKLGSALARHTGQDEAEAVSHLWGRLGILLQRGNAAILGNRIPALPDPQRDGIM